MEYNKMAARPERDLARTELARLQSELDELKQRLRDHTQLARPLAAAAQKIQEVLRRRRDREVLFGEGVFSDPAWDILLELWLAATMEQRRAISELGKAAGIPPTTTLRWIGKLEECGLVIREADHLDARRVFVELTSKAQGAMQSYFGE